MREDPLLETTGAEPSLEDAVTCGWLDASPVYLALPPDDSDADPEPA